MLQVFLFHAVHTFVQLIIVVVPHGCVDHRPSAGFGFECSYNYFAGDYNPGVVCPAVAPPSWPGSRSWVSRCSGAIES
jgi:hypothetical protein